MNEPEKERILKMVAEGLIRPGEAAQLLAALSTEPALPAEQAPAEPRKADTKPPLVEVQMQRPDGTTTTIQVPPNLVPMFVQLAKVAIKESLRNAARDFVDGSRIMVKNKAADVKNRVEAFMDGRRPDAPPGAASSSPSSNAGSNEARTRILQMVQNGRLSAEDASRLIRQIDALRDEGLPART